MKHHAPQFALDLVSGRCEPCTDARAQGSLFGAPESRHESALQKGLFFWAESTGDNPRSFMVVSQVDGFPATEACDDWFMSFEDADAIAQKLAKDGEL